MEKTRNTEEIAIFQTNYRVGFDEAKKMAEEKGGKLPKMNEFIRALKNPGQRSRFRGNQYWLGDEHGLDVHGFCKIDFDRGELTQVSAEEYFALSPRERTYAKKGQGPLFISITDSFLSNKLYNNMFIGVGEPSGNVAFVSYTKIANASDLPNSLKNLEEPFESRVTEYQVDKLSFSERKRFASDSDTAPALQAKLARDHSAYVLRALATNPNITEEAQDILIKRMPALRNKSNHLINLLRDPSVSPRVRQAAESV